MMGYIAPRCQGWPHPLEACGGPAPVPGTTDVPPISGKGRRVFLVGMFSPTAEAARIDGDARLHVSFASHEIVSKGFPGLCLLQLLEREKR